MHRVKLLALSELGLDVCSIPLRKANAVFASASGIIFYFTGNLCLFLTSDRDLFSLALCPIFYAFFISRPFAP